MSEKIEFDAEQITVQDDLLLICGEDKQVIVPADYTGRVIADHFRAGLVSLHVSANGAGILLDWSYR